MFADAVQELVAARRGWHDEMGRERNFGGADSPNVQIMHGRDLLADRINIFAPRQDRHVLAPHPRRD